MRTLTSLALILVCLTGCSAPVESEPAEAPPSESERAARLLFDAMHDNDWPRVAERLHPDALAEIKSFLWPFMQQVAEQGGDTGPILSLFDGVDSMEALEQLGDLEFFSNYLVGRTTVQPEIGGMLANSSTEILGELPGDNENETFVVYRLRGSPAGVQFENLDVVIVRRDGEGWKPMLTDDIKSLSRPF